MPLAIQKTIEIKGIQYFSGTQKHSLKKLKREIGYLDEFLISVSDKTGFSIQELEFGPGLPYLILNRKRRMRNHFFMNFPRCWKV